MKGDLSLEELIEYFKVSIRHQSSFILNARCWPLDNSQTSSNDGFGRYVRHLQSIFHAADEQSSRYETKVCFHRRLNDVSNLFFSSTRISDLFETVTKSKLPPHVRSLTLDMLVEDLEGNEVEDVPYIKYTFKWMTHGMQLPIQGPWWTLSLDSSFYSVSFYSYYLSPVSLSVCFSSAVLLQFYYSYSRVLEGKRIKQTKENLHSLLERLDGCRVEAEDLSSEISVVSDRSPTTSFGQDEWMAMRFIPFFRTHVCRIPRVRKDNIFLTSFWTILSASPSPSRLSFAVIIILSSVVFCPAFTFEVEVFTPIIWFLSRVDKSTNTSQRCSFQIVKSCRHVSATYSIDCLYPLCRLTPCSALPCSWRMFAIFIIWFNPTPMKSCWSTIPTQAMSPVTITRWTSLI